MILTATFNLLALIGTAVIVDVRATLGMVVGVAALAMVLRPLNGLTRRRAADNRDNNNAFATSMTEVVGLAQEVTLFDVGASIEAQIRSATERAAHSQRQVTYLSTAVPGVYQSLAVVIVLAGLAVVHTTGAGSVAELGAVVLLLIRSVSYGQQLQVGGTALNRVLLTSGRSEDLEGDYATNRRQAGDEPVTDTAASSSPTSAIGTTGMSTP